MNIRLRANHDIRAAIRLGGILTAAYILGGLFALPSIPEPLPDNTVIFAARSELPPFSYMEDGKWRGYSIELCKKIFEQYKKDQTGKGAVELRFEPVSAVTRFTALEEEDGRVQALCGATTVTLERMKKYNFTLLTFVSGASVVKLRDADVGQLLKPAAKTLAVRVCFVRGTTTEQYLKQVFEDTPISPLPKDGHKEAFEALEKKEADFYFGDRIILRQRLKNNKNSTQFILAPGFLTYEPYAIAVRKENGALLDSANRALARLYRSGDIYKIYDRCFEDARKSDLLKAMYELQKIPE